MFSIQDNFCFFAACFIIHVIFLFFALDINARALKRQNMYIADIVEFYDRCCLSGKQLHPGHLLVIVDCT